MGARARAAAKPARARAGAGLGVEETYYCLLEDEEGQLFWTCLIYTEEVGVLGSPFRIFPSIVAGALAPPTSGSKCIIFPLCIS
eukprot:SAG11_NODE_142_length_14906_cov_8.352333_13_plen_84_part_00